MGGWSECDWGSEFERVGVGWGGGKFGLLIIDWYVAWVM